MSVYRKVRRRLRHGGRMESRFKRYLIAAVVGCCAAWGLSIGYLKLTHPTYTSGFVLVLPGSGEGSSLNLASLGQATTTSAPAFSSPEISPTENYRQMLLGRRLIKAAAAAVGEPDDTFPAPKVELSDMTRLITVKMVGGTAEQAARRAEAVRMSFEQLLDSLRHDEIARRDDAYRALVAGYEEAVNAARQKLTVFEASSGLMSDEQYGTIVASVEHLRENLRDVDSKLANMRAGAAELTRQLGATPEQAALAMVLRSDPLFQALIDQLAKEDAEMATLTGTRGQNNPRVVDLQSERASTASRIASRAAELSGGKRLDVAKLRDLSLHDERARLFERLIGETADVEATAAMQAQLKTQIATEQARVLALAPAASKLDDLRRDVQVAEAVFSSALAKIDTNKSDLFVSYPMVQTLELADVPLRPSSPLPKLAIAGGLAATLLLLASLGLTWLRTALLARILKSA